MILKLIAATTAKPGTTILWEGTPCVVRSNDMSKTGKHGSMKCRMEVIGIFDGKKRIALCPGDDKLEVPLVDKRRGQVLSVTGDKASVMDLENFETIDMAFMEDVKDDIATDKQVEYWDIEGKKVIMRMVP